MNIAITIVLDDRETNDIFVAASVVAWYTWNSFPIDGTNILRSVPVIDRELRFPLDIELSDLPFLVSNNAESVVSYLRLTDSNRHFATAILKILIEDRRTTHVECIHNSRNIVTMHPGDIVMARTYFQSNKSKDKFTKINIRFENRSRLLKV